MKQNASAKLYQCLQVEERSRAEQEVVMHIVYILVSRQYSERIYIGLTEDISRRLDEHNSGKSAYTKKYGPWQLVAHITFSKKAKATEFERYLKSGSGFAFVKKHLV